MKNQIVHRPTRSVRPDPRLRDKPWTVRMCTKHYESLVRLKFTGHRNRLRISAGLPQRSRKIFPLATGARPTNTLTHIHAYIYTYKRTSAQNSGTSSIASRKLLQFYSYSRVQSELTNRICNAVVRGPFVRQEQRIAYCHRKYTHIR